MPPATNISLFKDVKDMNIEGSSFIMQNAPVTNYHPRTTHYGPVYNQHFWHTTVINGEDVLSSESQKVILPRDAGQALLSKGRQLMNALPVSHRKLAQQLARRFRPSITIQDNVVLVGVPLLSASIFRTLSEEVQVLMFYLLVVMILVDRLDRSRLDYKRPTSQVTVMDALGEYHDFPWAACENLTTFHRELLKRSWNQTGFSFVKQRWYEVEYNGCTLRPEDWAVVKPFTCLFVDFIHIQQGYHGFVKCPWCQWTNVRPVGSDTCSCSQCDRDFFVTTFISAIGGSAAVSSPMKDESELAISTKIRRLRIKFRLEQASLQPQLNREFDDAMKYLKRVKAAFYDQPDIYKGFLGILQDYQQERPSELSVQQRVFALFEGHPSLYQEFEHFLP